MATYTTKLGDKICEATATSSIGLRHICKQLALPYSTVTNWIYNKEHELHNKYADAKMMQLHHLAEEILEIADDSTNDYMAVVRKGKKVQVLNREAISRSRLRINSRIALIAKLAPIIKASDNNAKQKHSIQVAKDRELEWYGTQREEYEAEYTAPDIPDPISSAWSGSSEAAGRSVAEKHEENIPFSSPKKPLEPALEEGGEDIIYVNNYMPDQTRHYPKW